MGNYKVIIADDHPIFREGLKRLIEDEPGVEVVAEASDGIELLDVLKSNIPDMVILDISMPRLRGLEAIKEIKAIDTNIKILVLTMYKNKEYVYHAISSGARGYLLKEDTDLELFSAIKTIRAGKIYLTRGLAESITEDIICGKSPGGKKRKTILTTREKEVLKLVAEAKTSKEIAELLNISVRTAENHRASIMKKLKLKNIAALVRYAIENGYLATFSHIDPRF